MHQQFVSDQEYSIARLFVDATFRIIILLLCCFVFLFFFVCRSSPFTLKKRILYICKMSIIKFPPFCSFIKVFSSLIMRAQD